MTNTCGKLWVGDFEYYQDQDLRPVPVCFVLHEINTGERHTLWLADAKLNCPVQAGDTLVCFYAPAEMSCFKALGWRFPDNILDLYAEYRNATNGLSVRNGLLDALKAFKIDSIAHEEKEEMRDLILRGPPWSEGEKEAICWYCDSDVVAAKKLFHAMRPALDGKRSLLRGHYGKAVACMEWNGVPVDLVTLTQINLHWNAIKISLITEIDRAYGVFDGESFKQERWARWLEREQIPWKKLDSGKLALDKDTFRDMARLYPKVSPMHELRVSLSGLRLNKLSVGRDGRNRCMLSPYKSKTGRNQPSSSRYIFGPAVWVRYLIKPEPGMSLAYIDYSQQEFGIAAACSGDPMMKAAYLSGDPYLAFAKQAGAAPEHATKHTHRIVRDLFKQAILAVQYGMTEKSLSVRINRTVPEARELLDLHRKTYSQFWEWIEKILCRTFLTNNISTVFGWTQRLVPEKVNYRSLLNFPMQANGAEILRLACNLCFDYGVQVCAPVHDALLVEAPTSEIDQTIERAQAAMGDASEWVLGGFRLQTDVKKISFPSRFTDERGEVMWNTVTRVLSRVLPGPCPKGGVLRHR